MQGEEWDEPDDVPGVVRGEEEHQGRGEGEGWGEEGGFLTPIRSENGGGSLLCGGLEGPEFDGGEDEDAKDEEGSGGKVS